MNLNQSQDKFPHSILFSRIFAHLLHSKPEDELVQILYKKVYENLIEEIDAVDNGIDVCSEGTPRYQITTTLSQRVGR